MKTRKSFYRALKKTVNMFDWKLDAGHIRGFIKNEPSLNYRPFCPLTAVHFCRTGLSKHRRRWITQVKLATAYLKLANFHKES